MLSGLDSTDKLFMKHSSKPYNPKLADVFFKSGMIEAWGRGFDKIREACAKYNASLPEYNISASGIMVFCKACDKYLELLHGELHPVQKEQDDEQDVVKLSLLFVQNPNQRKKLWKSLLFPIAYILRGIFLMKC